MRACLCFTGPVRIRPRSASSPSAVNTKSNPTNSIRHDLYSFASLTRTNQLSKVTVLGAAGGIGQPLSLLLKLNPRVTELALYDIRGSPGTFFNSQLWPL